MITARKLRDAAFAVLLAIPTISMSRPAATQAATPAADRSPIMAHAALTTMSTSDKRSAMPPISLPDGR